MKLKILSYNILHGFHTIEPPNFQLEKKRLDAVKKIIKKENPDILGIPEACFCGPNEFNIELNYKKIFNFQYSIDCAYDWEWGITLLSKIPLEKPTTFVKSFGKGISAQIKIKNKIINLVLIHPKHDATDKEKIHFIKPILDSTNKPLILFGDFNALSDDDKYDREKMYRAFKHFAGRHYKQKVDKLLDVQLVPFIKSYGLKDVLFTLDKHEPTIPTELIKHPNDNSPIRLDYFFTSKDIKVKNAYTIIDKHSEIASDHYPIVCEIEVK